MGKSETFISYEDVKRSFVDKITVSGGRLLGGSRVTLKTVCIYLNGVLSKIAALPRVEIVRCKDCKYSVFEQWVDASDIYTCNRTSLTRACGDCSPTDFCSWGERKDEVKDG